MFVGGEDFNDEFSSFVSSNGEEFSCEDDCGDYGGYAISVYEEGYQEIFPDVTNLGENGCVSGNTVKIEKNGNNIIVNELVVVSRTSGLPEEFMIGGVATQKT